MIELFTDSDGSSSSAKGDSKRIEKGEPSW